MGRSTAYGDPATWKSWPPPHCGAALVRRTPWTGHRTGGCTTCGRVGGSCRCSRWSVTCAESSLAPLLDPELSAVLEAHAARIAELRGWPPRTLGSVRRGIRILCVVHEIGEPIRASTIAQLTHNAIPSNHVLEVFEDLDVLLDDRPDAVQTWCDARLDFLSARDTGRGRRLGRGFAQRHPALAPSLPAHGRYPDEAGPAVPARADVDLHNTASGHP